MENWDLIIVGGGAAGLSAAAQLAGSRLKTLLVEQGPRVGKKILATGNGRCNLSNTAIGLSPEGLEAYNHPQFVAGILAEHSCEQLRSWFASLGLLTVADSQGCVWPRSNSAASVLNVLRLAIAAPNIELRCDFAATSIKLAANGFELEASGSRLQAAAVLMAAGPQAAAKLLPGLEQVRLRPLLGPLRTPHSQVKGLEGLRASCEARLLRAGRQLASQRGELQFKKDGLSGIMAFNLSRLSRPGDQVYVDLLPEHSLDQLTELLQRRQSQLGERSCQDFLEGMLQGRLGQSVLRQAQIAFTQPAAQIDARQLAAALKGLQFEISSGPAHNSAQVTGGGLAVNGFDSHSLQSLKMPRLFAAGEALDVDAACGGFNLHWAWSSGRAAAKSIASMLTNS
jgi:predicted Rossmann fold flavoprotein